MIEFNGYLTGKAVKRFHYRSIIIGQKILLLSAFLILPVIICLMHYLGNGPERWIVFCVFWAFLVVSSVLLWIPKSPQKTEMIPKCIYVEDTYITCIADKYEETKNISDVKQIYDFGEFYEIEFPFGRTSEKFICQKNLLKKGSLAEFEEIFEGKIIKKA